MGDFNVFLKGQSCTQVSHAPGCRHQWWWDFVLEVGAVSYATGHKTTLHL